MKKQKNKLAGLQRRKAFAGYLFISPFIIGFLVFMIKPMFESFYMSFSEVQVGPGFVNKTLNGVKNYYDILRINPDYVPKLTDELWRMIIYSLGIIVFSLFVSLILNQEFKCRGLVRAIFFLPVIMSSGVILGLESNNSLMAEIAKTVETTTSNVSITAVLQTILKTTGVGTKAFEIVFEIIDNIYDVAVASGIQIIIFLSGLQTISSSMYEAADIEGCTKWESFWKITFPMVSSLFLVNWVYTIVDFCMRSDNEVMKVIDKEMIQLLHYGTASAMSWLYFGIVTLFVAVTSFFISKGVYYYD
ncbi:MAG: sugar ABC transporter permease [Lachnospiraceae bacterium]|nr:sugar ABC transporter permease [Lachnospiraceae bacterium]